MKHGTSRLGFTTVFLVLTLFLPSPLAEGEDRKPLLKLASDNAGALGQFGWKVAVHGNHGVVGSPGKMFSIHDDQGVGSAYVVDMETGESIVELLPPLGFVGVNFGASVAVSGSFAVVAASDRNVYVYDVTDGTFLYKLQTENVGPREGFGHPIAMNDSFLLVSASTTDAGAQDSGVVYVFDVATGQQLQRLAPEDPRAHQYFGCSLGLDGTRALIGAFGDDEIGFMGGAAYYFDLEDGRQIRKILRPEEYYGMFGQTVAFDGNLAAFGNPSDNINGDASGSVSVYDLAKGAYTHALISDDGWPQEGFGLSSV